MEEISAEKFVPIWDEIAKNEKLTDTGLCSRLGIHPGTIARWRDGTTETVRLRLIRTIEAKLGYRVETEADGSLRLEKPEKGWQPRADPLSGRSHDSWAASRREVLSLPLAAEVRAVGGSVALKKSGSLVPVPESELRDCFYLQVEDASMEPVLFKGDTLLVSRKTGRIKEGLAVIVSKDSTRIRRVITEPNQVKLLLPDSSKNPELFNGAEEVICPILCTFHSRAETGHGRSEP